MLKNSKDKFNHESEKKPAINCREKIPKPCMHWSFQVAKLLWRNRVTTLGSIFWTQIYDSAWTNELRITKITSHILKIKLQISPG